MVKNYGFREGNVLLPSFFENYSSLNFTEQFELAGIYSDFFSSTTNSFAPEIRSELQIESQSSVEVMVREAVVCLGYLFLDHLIRLNKIYSSKGSNERISVPLVAPHETPQRMEEFLVDCRTLKFRASMTSHMANIFDFKQIELPNDVFWEPRQTSSKNFVNYNFNRTTYREYFRRWRRLYLLKYRSRSIMKIPTLSMSYSTNALINSGFFGSYLESIQGRFQPEHSTASLSVRDRIFAKLESRLADSVYQFVDKTNLSASGLRGDSVVVNMISFLKRYWPISLLESMSENLSRASDVLHPYRGGVLLVGERGNLESLVLIAAAKSLGIRSLNCQHGGHIGYLFDQTHTREIEENICDRFISWGWSELPDYPMRETKIPVDALPNPWLSERRKFWIKTIKNKKSWTYDLLFFSSRMHRFQTAPSGAYQLIVDYLGLYNEFVVELVKNFSKRGYSIYHKPYNEYVLKLMSPAMSQIQQFANHTHVLDTSLNKGLHPQLVNNSNIILFDNPGTGFLESMSSGLPTICCWPRLYSAEEPSAAPYFNELESVGICHNSISSAVDTYDDILRYGAQRWFDEPRRKRARESFCERYALTSERWEKDWEQYFRSLTKSNSV